MCSQLETVVPVCRRKCFAYLTLILCCIISWIEISEGSVQLVGHQCGTVKTVSGKRIKLRENVTLSDEEFGYVNKRKLHYSEVIPERHCKIQVCGHAGTGVPAPSGFIGFRTTEWFDCETFVETTKLTDFPFMETFNTSSIACGCNTDARNDPNCGTDCYEEMSRTWGDTDCAILYEEKECRSCYFPAIKISDNETYKTDNSHHVLSLIVRDGCSLTHELPAFPKIWRFRTEKTYRTHTGPYIEGSIFGTFHSDYPEVFTCNCGTNKIVPPTTTTASKVPDVTTQSVTTTQRNEAAQRTTILSGKDAIVNSSAKPDTSKSLPLPSWVTTLPGKNTIKSSSKPDTSDSLPLPSWVTTLPGKDSIKPSSKPETSESLSLPTWIISSIVVLGILPVFICVAWKKKGQCIRPFTHASSEASHKDVENVVQVQNATTIQPQTIVEEPTTARDPKIIPEATIDSKLQKLGIRECYIKSQTDFTKTNEILGRGSFGTVRKGSMECTPDDDGLAMPLAVKVFDQNNPIAVDSFDQEVQTYQTINNESMYVVKFYGAYCDTKTVDGINILLDFCEGGSLLDHVVNLRAYIKDRPVPHLSMVPLGIGSYYVADQEQEAVYVDRYKNKLNPEETFSLIKYCYQIACGMEFLHEKGIIHTDLALKNCLLKDDTVKLCDFGLSKACINNQYFSGSIMECNFPFNSFAPEWNHIDPNNPKRVTKFIDIWAFGCLMWEIFSLDKHLYPDVPLTHPSIRFPSVGQLLNQGYRHDPPELLDTSCLHLMPLYQMMLRCWDQDRKARPAFSVLTKELQNIVANAELARSE